MRKNPEDGCSRLDNPGRGVVIALPISLALWVVIILLTAWSMGYIPA